MLASSHPALLVLPPLALCAGALLQILMARLLSSGGKGLLATLSAVPALAGVLAVLPAIRSGAVLHLSLASWDGPFAVVLHADALSVLFALMGTLLGSIVLLYSIDYMAMMRRRRAFTSPCWSSSQDSWRWCTVPTSFFSICAGK
jgi:formate hydrogenlyase subunit 3/multisubunit Na+/H+ antiporter MnhD subunit